jgi:hypothetical protein
VVADTTWVPDGGTFLTSGEGTGDNKAACGRSDTHAMAYFPSSRSIIVNTTVIAGSTPVQLRWFDPSSGDFTLIANAEAQSASRSITYPGNNDDGQPDWVLLVNGITAVDPTTVTATVSVPTPAVTTSGTDVNVTPSVVAAIVDVPAPTVAATLNLTATEVTAVVDVPAPVVNTGGQASVTAVVVTATVEVTSPAAVGGAASAGATEVDALVSVPSPAIATSAAVTAAVVTAAVSVLLPVLIGDPITLHRLRCPPSSWG